MIESLPACGKTTTMTDGPLSGDFAARPDRPVVAAQRHSNVSRKSRKAAGQSLMRLSPDAQRAVRGSLDKVLVRRE